MTKPTRFAVVATCTISGSSLEGQEARLWFGKSVDACKRSMVRLQEKYGSYYRDWKVVEA